MFVLTKLINSTLKINHIFKKSNPHFIIWMAGSISNFTHIDTGVVNGVVTTVYNRRGFVFLYKYNYLGKGRVQKKNFKKLWKIP